MGTVFSARDEKLGRLVAIKLLKEELSSDPRVVERFRREARAVAAMSHPNVASVFDYGEDEGRHFIVMELIEGRDLAQVMREDGPLEPARATAIAEQIALALGHAHAGGLIHRDVKPPNVIVVDDDRVKVTDFGIARAMGESTLTATGTILGTAQYVSPEQASGEDPGPPSDVYSLGIVLYEMVTGAVPFTGDSPISVALRHVRDEVPAPSSIDPAIPATIDELVATATAKQPWDRYPDGSAFAAALAGRTGEVPPTVPIGVGAGAEAQTWPFTHPPRWDPNRLGRTVLIAFGILFLIALAALAFRLADSTAPIRERNQERAAGEREPATQTPEVAGFTLPDYRGQPADEAVTELEDAGLSIDAQPEECGQTFGYVCEQSPEPGSILEEGDTVTLVISTSGGEDSDDDEESGKKPKAPPGQEKKDKDDD